ncbi:hypothetical protein [Kitasatospora sp. NPDC058218]|uniref:hypothetical protein n=1 Tax=Kitasatospora sp. NPDC058218 TaxID=3346385 RepID=UPI0036DE8311
MTFAQLRHTALEPLDRAGDTWNSVSGHMEQISAQVRSGILQPLTGTGPYAFSPAGHRPWTGAAAAEAAREIGLLAEELSAFHYEALAVTAALRRARSSFAEAGQNLLRAIADAEALGATVAEDGTATLPALPSAERNDPDSIAYRQRKWNELQGHVDAMHKAVAAATEADATTASALRAINPDEVDPATRSNAVADARADLAAAAGMPTSPQVLPAWWAALDPAVRAGLLASGSEKLVSAGVLSPTVYQWTAPDLGSGTFRSREPSLGDRTTRAEVSAMAAAGSLAGYTDAARHMQHYLDGSGEPLSLDVERMLRDDATFRAQVTDSLASSQAAWRQTALDAFARSGGAPVAVPVETPVFHRTINSDDQRNWYLAVGSHPYVASGVVTAEPGPGGNPKLSVQYQVNVWDRYNWDPGKGTPIAGINVSDSDLAKLHETGLAREFDMSGRSTPMTLSLDDIAAVRPAGSGERYSDREGGRGDAGRKTR